MANIIELLIEYKNDVVALGHTDNEKYFIKKSFIQWFLNSKPDDSFMPNSDIVIKSDLQFANLHNGCHFQIATMKNASGKIFNLFKKKVNKLQSNVYPNQDSLVNESQLQHLRLLFKPSNDMDFENSKNQLIAIYNFIGLESCHSSIPPIFNGIELFGCPLNTQNSYCSPFILEKQFGSLGSFFDFSISKSSESLFICNPPSDVRIIFRIAEHLISELHESKIGKTIIINIPGLDSADQKGTQDFGIKCPAYRLLIESKYIIDNDVLDCYTYPYWNFFTQKSVVSTYTYLIILANHKTTYNIQNIKNKWKYHQN